MGTTGFSASFSSTFSSVFSSNMHPILGAVLAGLGFWPKPARTPPAPAKAKNTDATSTQPESKEQPAAPCAIPERMPEKRTTQAALQPLRVIRFVETEMPAANAAQMAGRMVISGRMADVCAELDRLAA
jgi:hypothetical protein